MYEVNYGSIFGTCQHLGSIFGMEIFDRLREERNRIGLSQSELGAALSVGKTTVIRWEKGESYPDAVQLAKLIEIGIDAAYIVTGARSSIVAEAVTAESLTPQEKALLDNYRHAPEMGKLAVRSTLEAVAEKPKPKRKIGM